MSSVVTWLITYLDKCGAFRSALTYSHECRAKVRLFFLSDFPSAQEILLCEPVHH